MKRLGIFFLLLVPTLALGQAVEYRDKNTATRVCGSVWDNTTAKHRAEAAAGVDCEYAVTLDGTSESAFTDLATAEAVIGTDGQFCALITAGEINIDGDLRLRCKFTNTNAADWEKVLSTRRPRTRLNSGDAAYDAVASRGTLQAASSTTATIAAGESFSNSDYIGDKLVIISGTGRGSWGCVTASVASTKVLTVLAWSANTPDNTSTYDIIPDAACKANIGYWNGTVVTGTAPTSSGGPNIVRAHN